MMSEKVFNVLFLCTGNSARSLIAEAVLNQLGRGRFNAYSAGSMPTGTVNPHVLDLLQRNNMSTEDIRSKSWDEFAAPDAPKLDFVFTVCDQAAGEVCPIWPGQPMTAHWGLEDPAQVEGEEEQKRAVKDAFMQLNRRIGIFVNLPIEKIERHSLQKELDEIGALPRI
jgi:arsenate reductase (thioredoxin)